MPNDKKIYDLEERTAVFGENIIEFAKKIPKNPITIPLIGQLVRSGTSVGSNYCEADCAESRKDFEHKMGISKKEAKESKHLVKDSCQGGTRTKRRSKNPLERSE